MKRERSLSGESHNTPSPRFTQTQYSHTRRHLLTSRFASSTASTYTTAVTDYLAFCRHEGRHHSTAQLDRCVQRYICHLHLVYEGRNRQRAVNAVYGLYMQRPDLRRQLQGSEALLQGWRRSMPPVSHPPLTWPITTAIARTMAANGYGECAIATLVAFDGLLRVGELVAVMVKDVSLPNDSRRGSQSRTPESARSAVSSSHPSSRHRASAYIRLAHRACIVQRGCSAAPSSREPKQPADNTTS